MSITTSRHPFIRLLKPGDPIFALYNTTGDFDGQYSSILTERAPSAIDGILSTKYVNRGNNYPSNSSSITDAIHTGFYVTSTINSATIAVGLRFRIGNDCSVRDPLTVTLEGKNSIALNSDFVWTLIYNDLTGINPISISSRLTYGTLQNFSNTIPYQSYRVLITSKRGSDSYVQYSEFEL